MYCDGLVNQLMIKCIKTYSCCTVLGLFAMIKECAGLFARYFKIEIILLLNTKKVNFVYDADNYELLLSPYLIDSTLL